MTYLLHHTTTQIVYMYTLARSSAMDNPTRIDLALTLLDLKPTCGPMILTADISALVIPELRMFEQLLL